MTHQTPEVNLERTLQQAVEGEPQAWRQLVQWYTPRLFSLLVRQCGDRDLAEEITQATFVQVVTHLGRYAERGRFEPWLFRIAMNRLRDEMRRRRRHAATMDMTPGAESGSAEQDSAWGAAQHEVTARSSTAEDPLEQVSRQELIARLREAVEQLSEADRQIVYLRHTAGLSFAQIAQTLDQPLGTVLARGHRALSKLRKLLEAEAQEP